MSKTIEIVEKLAQPIVEELGFKLINVEYVKEGKDWFLRVFIDSDKGVDIESCAIVNEKLSTVLDEVDPIENLYFLDVSSPGAERPIKTEKDYINAIGKQILIKTYEKINNEKTFEGKLTSFNNDQVIILQKIKTKNKEVSIPLEKISFARLSISFN